MHTDILEKCQTISKNTQAKTICEKLVEKES